MGLLKSWKKKRKKMVNRNEDHYSAEYFHGNDVSFFPPPRSKDSFPGKTMGCIVYTLSWGNKSSFVVKSADCYTTRGEGSTVTQALDNFRTAVEAVVVDGDGGLFLGNSSKEFHFSFHQSLEDGWIKDGVTIQGKEFHEITLFSLTLL